MHIGDMGASGVGDPKANLDGQLLKANGTGSHNNNTYPLIFKLVVIVVLMSFQSVKLLKSLYKKFSAKNNAILYKVTWHKYKMAATLGANHLYKNEPPYFPAHAPEVLVSSEVKASVGNPWNSRLRPTTLRLNSRL